jgi:hypothetical protein
MEHRRGKINEISALLEFYAAQNGSCIPTFRHKLGSYLEDPSCVISQKSADLIYTATEAQNHAK